MKKHLRLISWILSLTFLCELLPIVAFAQSDIGEAATATLATLCEDTNSSEIIGEIIEVFSGKCGDNLTYTRTRYGVLTISGTGEMSDNCGDHWPSAELRKIIVNDGVTSIGRRAFTTSPNLNPNLTTVVLPDSIDSIGVQAFSGQSNLEDISLPSHLTFIGNDAFSDCTSLKSITIPSSVTIVAYNAFSYCSNLSSITLSEGISSLEFGAFKGCSQLSSISIPSSIQTIPSDLFLNCLNLATVNIATGITSINLSAFYGCLKLSSINYAGTKREWSNISIIDDLNGANPLKNVVIHCTDGDINSRFEFKRDNLSFLNSGDYFFNDWELYYATHRNALTKYIDKITGANGDRYNYQISDEKFKQLTDGLSTRVKEYIQFQQLMPWYGSCSGMSRLVTLHYLEPDRIPLEQIQPNAASLYELESPKSSLSVENITSYYHLSQFLPSFQHYKADVYTRYQNNLSSEISDIVQSLAIGAPVICGIGADEGGHCIVLLKLLTDSDDSCTIEVYDPNYDSDENTPQILTLNKKTPYVIGRDKFPQISYDANYNFYRITWHLLPNDIEFIDLRNYFGTSNYETKSDYDEAHVSFENDAHTSLILHYGTVFVRTENGKLVECSDDVQVHRPDSITPQALIPSQLEFVFPKINSSEKFELEITPTENSNVDLLLNDTLLSISTNGPVKLTYDEANRTVDVTADTPTKVNLMLTQNDTNKAWPWHSWAVDTTDTTTLHAELDANGLHLSGDGLTNAEYATKNVTDDTVDSGTISVQPDDTTGLVEVTIVNQKEDASGKNKTEIVTPDPDPTPTPTPDPDPDPTPEPDPKPSPEPEPTPTPEPKPTPSPNNPTNPSAPTSSSGGSGGGAALVLGVGAVALTAGLVMAAQVDVQGKVMLDNSTALPNAKISLLQNGTVVMQTTTDENGAFVLKVKRGSYDLTVAYTDANGQLQYQTISIKAPAKNLTLSF